MELTQKIDGYCERMGPEYWAEPINAITNLAFILAGIWCLMMARRAGRTDGAVMLLSILIIVIGVGSYLFHTHATGWAALADVIPIGLFIFSFFAIAMNRFVGLEWWKAGVATVLFLAAAVFLSWLFRMTITPYIGGSTSYFPAMIALFVVGLYLRGQAHPAGGWLIAAGWIFVASLTFRALDLPLCGSVPFGTHFMWHILNGVVLATLVVSVIRHGAPRAAP
ncbi:MAG: ceramidase domain-containing protein [Pseudomonadota bacterium]